MFCFSLREVWRARGCWCRSASVSCGSSGNIIHRDASEVTIVGWRPADAVLFHTGQGWLVFGHVLTLRLPEPSILGPISYSYKEFGGLRVKLHLSLWWYG